jgi:hypothetical protein
MKVQVAFIVLSLAFGIAVADAAITTKKYVDTHRAEGHPAPRRQLRQQMRPIALDDPSYLRINSLDSVELLHLLTDGFELVRLQRPAPVKLHWRQATPRSGNGGCSAAGVRCRSMKS